MVIQSELHPAAYSGMLAVGAVVGASIELTRRVSLAVEAAIPAALIRRDGAAAIVVLPAGWLGIAVSL